MRTKEEQMKFAFMDGGMVASKKRVDPESGNPIPPGSLSEEVSDNVDAKLSEGEYVLPADVVQFLGMEKIEKLVKKAKEQLAEMDANGRIGGTPVKDEEASVEEDFPLSDEELFSEEQGYFKGGFVQANQGVETKIYVGPNGEKRSVLFMGGVPIQAIPSGFVPQGEAATVKTNEQVLTQTETPDGGRTEQERGMTSKSFSDFSTADFVDFASDTKTAGSVFGALGPVASGVLGSVNSAAANRAAQEIDERLGKDDLSEEDRASLTEARATLGEVSGGDRGSAGVFSGGLLGDLFGGKNKTEAEDSKGSSKSGGIFGGLFSGGKSSSSGNTENSNSGGSSSSSSGGRSSDEGEMR